MNNLIKLIPVITKHKIILKISKHCLMFYSSPQSLSGFVAFCEDGEAPAPVTRLLNK